MGRVWVGTVTGIATGVPGSGTNASANFDHSDNLRAGDFDKQERDGHNEEQRQQRRPVG